MAKRKKRLPFKKRLRRFVLRGLFYALLLVLGIIGLFRFVNPPLTHTQWVETRRLGAIEKRWVSLEEIAPVMARSAVAAEDANFCLHWGIDMGAVRSAIDAGGTRGASTISQQVVKNVFLWQGRSYVRKALEAVLTPVVEVMWPKERILEVYLNVAEFGEGVFGIEEAARATFGVTAADLTSRQASRLAVVLPNPKRRDAAALSETLRKRATRVASGAATIDRDGRADCFQS